MNIPYRTQRMLKRVGTVLMAVLVVGVAAWLCWVVWLQRYVVYTSDGAELDFEQSANDVMGERAEKPVAQENISIFYNEGADAIDTSNELKSLSGYYITSDMFKNDLENVLLQIERLPAGTAVMIEMKGPYGSFYYPSQLSDATISASTNVETVVDLVSKLKTKGFYTIAQVSAFRDREFGDKNVTCGLYMLSRAGLWMDQGGMYWLDPTNAAVTSWITSVVLELRDMGFNEVLLSNFAFPNTDQIIFNGDKQAALQTAANNLMSACSTSGFVLSFGVTDPTFQLPEGRSRMYLENIDPNSIARTISQVTVDDPEARVVFLSETADTRYDSYSVLRSMNVVEEVEARKEE